MFTNLLMTIRSMRGTGIDTPHAFHSRAANGTLQASRAKCTRCRECVSHCPTRALTATSTEVEFRLQFHPGRCIACVRCVDACPAGDLHFVRCDETFLLPDQPDEREVLR